MSKFLGMLINNYFFLKGILFILGLKLWMEYKFCGFFFEGYLEREIGDFIYVRGW